ncbi:Glutamine synthetase, beta-Grasp domain [Streptomyces sp. Ncost-T6T-2b]|nr:Glutamine synthetase, beta-Grasp domain [Streptomyces sp. Ncost-T6T-2b]
MGNGREIASCQAALHRPLHPQRMASVTFKAEYIWIDGTEPTAKLRSKTKIMDGAPSGDVADLPIWGFDGSSTNQAEGHASDRVLKPVFTCPDPIRGVDDVLVLCEVFNIDMTPHESNTRAALRPVAEQFAGQAPIFGIEQEYTFFDGHRPLGFPEGGFPAAQGGYYCGVGADEIFGRQIVEKHLDNCLRRGSGSPASTPRSCPASGSSRWARCPRWTSPTSCGWPVGCSTAPPRTSTSPRRWTRSRSRATGTVRARTPTSPPRRCARATTRSSPRASRWVRVPSRWTT